MLRTACMHGNGLILKTIAREQVRVYRGRMASLGWGPRFPKQRLLTSPHLSTVHIPSINESSQTKAVADSQAHLLIRCTPLDMGRLDSSVGEVAVRLLHLSLASAFMRT